MPIHTIQGQVVQGLVSDGQVLILIKWFQYWLDSDQFSIGVSSLMSLGQLSELAIPNSKYRWTGILREKIIVSRLLRI